MQLVWLPCKTTFGNLYLRFLWISSHVPFLFADFALYPFTVISHNYEYNCVLNPVSLPSKSLNLEWHWNPWHTCPFWIFKFDYYFKDSSVLLRMIRDREYCNPFTHVCKPRLRDEFTQDYPSSNSQQTQEFHPVLEFHSQTPLYFHYILYHPSDEAKILKRSGFRFWSSPALFVNLTI